MVVGAVGEKKLAHASGPWVSVKLGPVISPLCVVM